LTPYEQAVSFNSRQAIRPLDQSKENTMTNPIEKFIPKGHRLEGKIYPLGHKFTVTRGKQSPRVCTVADYRVTLDGQGQFVEFRYVVTYLFMGQMIVDNDVVQTTLDRAGA